VAIATDDGDHRVVMAANWSRFWASGAGHSCVGSFGADYGGAIRDWWLARFSALAADRVLLDVGTGGGPLPRMLVDLHRAAHSSMPRVVAADIAEVRFPWLADVHPRLAGCVTLLSGVAAERLPLADTSVDLACSQFGIEYARHRPAADEILRVLRPGGEAAFVLHLSDSVLVSVAREECANLEWLLGGWAGAMHSMIAPMARAATEDGRRALKGDPAAERARQGFNEAMRALLDRAARSRVPDVLLDARSAVSEVLSLAGRSGEAAGEAAWARWTLACRDALGRQSGLLAVAMDDARLTVFLQPFVEAGRVPDVTKLRHADGLAFGWGVRIAGAAA
jgi:SAM-dependent methyltransferase